MVAGARYTYAPSLLCESDVLSGCDTPAHYYQAILDVHFFWRHTWQDEGRMELELPEVAETDGQFLATQASHAIVLDMITRSDHIWPRYGTAPGCEFALPSSVFWWSKGSCETICRRVVFR